MKNIWDFIRDEQTTIIIVSLPYIINFFLLKYICYSAMLVANPPMPKQEIGIAISLLWVFSPVTIFVTFPYYIYSLIVG